MAIACSSLIMISGCSTDNQASDKNLKKVYVEPTEVKSPSMNYYDEDVRNANRNDFGFTRASKINIEGKNIHRQSSTLNLEQLADIITDVAVQLPNVHDAATLVTDEEVLIVYKTDSNNKVDTADQVKRAAMSIVPRYYHVYVSDNFALAPYIEDYATLDANDKKVDYSINKVIKSMLQSPQGHKLNKAENENGEIIHERNNHENIHEQLKSM